MTRSERTTRQFAASLLGLMVGVLLLSAGGGLERRVASQRRGIIYGAPPLIERLSSPWGVNTALEQYDEESMDRALERIADGGFHLVRQTFPWALIEPTPGAFRWEPWDRLVSAVGDYDLELVAVLDTAPAWAREGTNPRTPPSHEGDFGRFARAFASRYADRIDFYQVWDEPNLSAHWGDRYVSPADYARMLQTVALQIREADPHALILTAGMAPTWEEGPLNMDEAVFLDGLYRAGAQEYFDVVAAKPYGFWSGPDDRRVSSDVLNYSRVIRLRETMVAHDDSDRPIWAVEWGWASLPTEWAGAPSPWGTDEESRQIQRLQDAVRRERLEWPWLVTMIWATYQPAVPSSDPRWGLALVDQEGTPRPFYYALQQLATASPVAYPGRYPADHPIGRYEGEWRLAVGRADIGRSGDRLKVAFYGTELALVVCRGDYWAWLEVSVDGRPANMLPSDEVGRSYIVLYDPRGGEATVPVAGGLEDGVHELSVVAHGGWGQWALRGWVVGRRSAGKLELAGVALAAGGAVLALWAAWRAAHSVPDHCIKIWSSSDVTDRGCLPFCLLAGAWFAMPWGRGMMVGSATVFALVAAWQPLWALGTLLFSLPFYMSSRPIPGLPLASLDVLGAATLIGLIGRWVQQWWANDRKLRVATGHLGPCGRLLLMLAGLSLIATLAAEEQAVAWAAFWRMVLLPGLVYVLVWTARRGGQGTWQAVQLWLAGAVVAAAIGIYQYATGHVIAIEGVHRVAGPYSSPNHLALFLGWAVPMLILLGLNRKRPGAGWVSVARGTYLVALGIVLVGLYLTYSRATWLLSVPFSLLVLALTAGGPRRRWWWIGPLLALLVVVPWQGTERLRTLVEVGQGSDLRPYVWRGTWDMIVAHPLLGVGPGNFQIAYPRYMRPGGWPEPLMYHAHDVFLDFAALLGLGGLLLFIALLVVFFRSGYQLLGPPSNHDKVGPRGQVLTGRQRVMLIGLMAAAAGALAHGLVDHGYFLPDLACLWALALATMDRLAVSTMRSSLLSVPTEER